MPDHPQRDDVRDVLETAQRLGMCELKLFRAAYVAWHGEAPSPELLRQCLIDYRFQGRAPIWVRHFLRRARRVEPDAATSALSPSAGAFARFIGLGLVLAFPPAPRRPPFRHPGAPRHEATVEF